MACRSRHLIVHCAAPRRVRVHVVPVDAHEHKHAFADLADDLLVDGHARALDALQHETHGACVCCEEQWQQSCARQLGLSVQEFVKYSDGVASTASSGVVLAVAPRLGHAKMAEPHAFCERLSLFNPKPRVIRDTATRSEKSLEAWQQLCAAESP